MIPHHFHQCTSNDFTTDVYPDGMSLHNSCCAIYVYYKSWKVVALTMNEAVCGIGIALLGITRLTNYTDGIAYLQGS